MKIAAVVLLLLGVLAACGDGKPMTCKQWNSNSVTQTDRLDEMSPFNPVDLNEMGATVDNICSSYPRETVKQVLTDLKAQSPDLFL